MARGAAAAPDDCKPRPRPRKRFHPVPAPPRRGTGPLGFHAGDLIMATTWFSRWFKRKAQPVRKNPYRGRFLPAVEPLAERVMPAVTAVFSPGAQVLSVFGDSLDNTVTVSRDAAGKILVNGGAVTV